MSDLSEVRRWHKEHPSATSWTWRAVDTLLRTVDDQRSLLDGTKAYTQAVERQRDQLAAIVRSLATTDVEFGVSCPWHCAGDERGAGHDLDCSWTLAREWAAAHPEGDAP